MANHRKKNRRSKNDDESVELGLSMETKNAIWSILCFGAGILVVLAFLDKAGKAGVLFKGFSTALFGWGKFLVPTAFFILGLAFIKSLHRAIYKSAIIGTILFVMGFLSIFYIWGEGDVIGRIDQGGYLGVALGYPLLESVGFMASFIILAIILIISLTIALNIPLYRLIIPKKATEEEVQTKDEKNVDVLEKSLAKIVIKRGDQIIDEKMQAKAEAAASKSQQTSSKSGRQEEDKEFVIKTGHSGKWQLPPLSLLESDNDTPKAGDINANVTVIKRTLSNFGIDVEMGEVSIGPTVTQFTLRPAVGIKLSRITALQNDMSLALAAHPIRIEAPIPGKALVGIEVPNKKSALVGLRDLLEGSEYQKSKYYLPLALGRDVAGFPVYSGMERMPHMLIAGATGTGKSVTINTVLLSLLYKHSPDMLKLILIDPKRVELTLYNGIPHLITPVIVDAKKVVNALKWSVREMEKRYEKLSEKGSRDIFSYNAKAAASKEDIMPFIVICIDELADLMAAHGKDVEAAIVRLAQMARAVGIHLIVSTQRPSVEVITGLIKANITSRIALQVASQIDSRTILDNSGAEKLLGNGDMLYQSGEMNSKLKRIQAAFVNESEVKEVVNFIKEQANKLDEDYKDRSDGDLVADLESVDGAIGVVNDADADDDLFGEAKETVIQAQKASASFLQRRLRVGYARAARLLDLLEERNIIGPGDGAKPREVFVKPAGGNDESYNEAEAEESGE